MLLKVCNLIEDILSQYMVTDNDKMEADLDNPYILLTDKKISNIQEVLPLLQSPGQQGRPLLIIADDVDGEALPTLVLNKFVEHLTLLQLRLQDLAIVVRQCYKILLH